MTSTEGRILLGVVSAVLITACGGGEPTAPPAPEYPQVAGTYTGFVTLRMSAFAGSADFPMTLNVVQSGAQVTFSGSVTAAGEVLQLPARTGTVNQTGFVTTGGASDNEPWEDATCGTVTTTDSSLAFRGNAAELYLGANTDHCGFLTISGVLTR